MVVIKQVNANYYQVEWNYSKSIGVFYREVDGYFVWILPTLNGYLGSYTIRQIAERLDRLNQAWDEMVKAEGM